MESNELVTGIVDKFIFKNDQTGFSVLLLTSSGKQSIIVTGFLSAIHPGQHVQLQGAWVHHPKFGTQFQVNTCISTQPDSIVGLKKYLGSGLIKGIGKIYGTRLVDHFGADVLTIIEKNPERLKEVPGIGTKRIQQILEAWQTQKEISSIMVFLQDKGISTAYAAKIFKHYGKDSIARVKENPYQLAQDIWGIGFKSADKIAQQMGFELHSIERIKAGIAYIISQATNQGHLYVELNDLIKQAIELLTLTNCPAEELTKAALRQLYETEKIKLITHQENHYITLSSYYGTERSTAAIIKKLISHPSLFSFDLKAIYKKLNEHQSITLNEDQQHGILSCLGHKITIITGGPGTGKTTLIKQLLTILDMHRISYQLTAPTGRAAKRMFEGTNKPAQTIHRLLEFDGESFKGFKYNEKNALKLDFLIVDEASMIDIFLAHSLLKAIPFHAHIVFIGDIDQLPSVGAGNFLSDMIASNIIPFIRLTQIFRQAHDSLIVINAHKINKGEFPVSSMPGSKSDYRFIKEDDPVHIMNHLQTIFHACKSKSIPLTDIAVLVPMNRGIAGTFNLNVQLQQFLNPTANKKLIVAGTTFKEGDKVMQIRNNYDKVVFNGDIGFIEAIDEEEKTLTINFDGRIIEYDYDELNELVLAYALSIHKSQGSEYPVVIIPLFMQHFMLLQRNLIYTALTRAKKLCIFIGQFKALAIAIKNNKTTTRITFLKQFLIDQLPCE